MTAQRRKCPGHGLPDRLGRARSQPDGDDVLHAYSTYARGLDILIATYAYLELTPFGRNEEGLPHTMSWVRHHDEYDHLGR